MTGGSGEWAARIAALVSLAALFALGYAQVRSTFDREATVSDTTVGGYLFQERPSERLGGGAEVRQTIRPRLDGLVRVDVRFSRPGAAGSTTRVRIEGEDGSVLAEATAPSSQVLAGNMYAFAFDRIARSAGRRLELVVDAPDAPPGKGPSVTWVGRDILPGGHLVSLPGTRFAPPADLFVNLRTLPADPSSRDELLAARINAYRPGWVGWKALLLGAAVASTLLGGAWIALIGTGRWMQNAGERIWLALSTTVTMALLSRFLAG